MIEAVIRLVAGVLWEFVLYGTGRLAIPLASLGFARGERLSGEAARLGWLGLRQDPDGTRVVSLNLTGLIGGAMWLAGLLVLLASLGRL